MIIHVTVARVVGPHSLEVEFNNGVRKRINLRRELNGVVFEPLRDPRYFAHARLDPELHTVVWPNGADFAPDFLFTYEPEVSPAAA